MCCMGMVCSLSHRVRLRYLDPERLYGSARLRIAYTVTTFRGASRAAAGHLILEVAVSLESAP